MGVGWGVGGGQLHVGREARDRRLASILKRMYIAATRVPERHCAVVKAESFGKATCSKRLAGFSSGSAPLREPPSHV